MSFLKQNRLDNDDHDRPKFSSMFDDVEPRRRTLKKIVTVIIIICFS